MIRKKVKGKSRRKAIKAMDKPSKQRVKQAIRNHQALVPEERDEYATKDDLHMHKIAMEELQRGETVPHGSVDWS